MQGTFFLLLLVVLVNVGCIFSFARANKALRDLGAAWVRALSAASERNDATAPPREPPRTLLALRRVVEATATTVQRQLEQSARTPAPPAQAR